MEAFSPPPTAADKKEETKEETPEAITIPAAYGGGET
jgi:hypothetical protein